MPSFLKWWATRPKTERNKPPEQSPLYIANREEGIGIIMKASLEYSKATGKPYIRTEVSLSETDRVVGFIGRLQYTQFVIRECLSTDYDAEEFNIAYMVGMSAKVRFNHKEFVDGKILPAMYILEIK